MYTFSSVSEKLIFTAPRMAVQLLTPPQSPYMNYIRILSILFLVNSLHIIRCEIVTVNTYFG